MVPSLVTDFGYIATGAASHDFLARKYATPQELLSMLHNLSTI